jgi:hypothetical protein
MFHGIGRLVYRAMATWIISAVSLEAQDWHFSRRSQSVEDFSEFAACGSHASNPASGKE